jgi:acyl carrier protein
MSETRSRLVNCFAVVFPSLSPAEIPVASINSVGSWDSLATVNLIAVIEEEFKIQVSPDDLTEMVSFELILDYLEQRQHAS